MLFKIKLLISAYAAPYKGPQTTAAKAVGIIFAYKILGTAKYTGRYAVPTLIAAAVTNETLTKATCFLIIVLFSIPLLLLT